MVMVHLCRDAAFLGRLSHDTFFYGVGLAVLSCRSRWIFLKWSDRCYSVVTDEDDLLVCEYGCNGAENNCV